MERPKHGFGIPIHKWFKEDLSGFFKHYLSYEKIKKQNIFNADYVKKSLGEYLEGKSNNANKLWLLLVFQMWYEKWM